FPWREPQFSRWRGSESWTITWQSSPAEKRNSSGRALLSSFALQKGRHTQPPQPAAPDPLPSTLHPISPPRREDLGRLLSHLALVPGSDAPERDRHPHARCRRE